MRLSHRSVAALALVGGVLAFVSPATAQVFVDANATGNDDGTSWDDAFPDLQAALANATGGDEI